MNATQSNLLTRSEKMGESTLVTLSDWELAYLRVAMVRQVEEALEVSLRDRDVCQGADDTGACVLEDQR